MLTGMTEPPVCFPAFIFDPTGHGPNFVLEASISTRDPRELVEGVAYLLAVLMPRMREENR
jgi:hypothetical protein